MKCCIKKITYFGVFVEVNYIFAFFFFFKFKFLICVVIIELLFEWHISGEVIH